jgi:hypothetical protein
MQVGEKNGDAENGGEGKLRFALASRSGFERGLTE